MSRSYKKFPLFRDNLWGRNSMKKGKKYANRKIRRKLKNPDFDISNGRYYKFLGIDTWDLYEYVSYKTEQDAIDEWESEQKMRANGIYSWLYYENTLEEELKEWKKYYKSK